MGQVIIENLSKIYSGDKGREVLAVEEVNLTVNDREFMVFVGPSGCGKSTLLRMIAGLEEISRGAISIDGLRVNDVPPKDRDIAMVFQNYALYPHMTVYKNMAFGLELRKIPRDEIDRRVREAAQILGLTNDMLERRPKALSGGQRQRVAVGRSIVRKPKVFLFDEPLSNLDAKMRVQMRTEILKLHRQLRTTMIYVTHDQVEAMTMGDRICVLKDGRVQQVAEPLEIYNRPATMFVAGFIGSPPMNFFSGTLVRKGDGLFFAEAATSLGEGRMLLRVDPAHAGRLAGSTDKPIILGLRPEDLGSEAGADPGGVFEAAVDVTETLGAESYLHLNSGAHLLVARERGQTRFTPSERVAMTANMAKAHFFDVADRAPFLNDKGDLDIDRWHAACAAIT